MRSVSATVWTEPGIDARAVYNESDTPLWYTRGTAAGSRITMQTDGNLVEYSPSDAVVWNSRTAGNPGAYAVMQNDGNLVIYLDGVARWNSFAAGLPKPPAPPAPAVRDTLSSGQQLNRAESLVSGSSTAVLQGDGNFVVYSSGRALWNSRTNNNPGARLVMQSDGNLVVYSTSGRALWNSRDSSRPKPAPAPAPAPPAPAPPTPAPPAPNPGVYYANCAAAWAAGAAPLHRGDPGYRPGLDGDGDGTACEHRP